MAPVYDLIFGALLQPGRRRAVERLAPEPGERILEVGIGTGLSALDYPPGVHAIGVDLSAPMLEKAQSRLAKHDVHVRLCRMDAARLGFADSQFDAVYAPYFLNTVPDPIGVARELRRVCRPEGRLVFVNHFDRRAADRTLANRLIGRFAGRVGVDWHVNLDEFLRRAGLAATLVELVNRPRMSSVVVCRPA